MTVTWHGRAAEYRDLLDAVTRNCSCEYGIGVRTCCAAHRMIAEEQRVLDGLLFARRMSERLRREEWMEAREPAAAPRGTVHQATGTRGSTANVATPVWDGSHVVLTTRSHPVGQKFLFKSTGGKEVTIA